MSVVLSSPEVQYRIAPRTRLPRCVQYCSIRVFALNGALYQNISPHIPLDAIYSELHHYHNGQVLDASSWLGYLAWEYSYEVRAYSYEAPTFRACRLIASLKVGRLCIRILPGAPTSEGTFGSSMYSMSDDQSALAQQLLSLLVNRCV